MRRDYNSPEFKIAGMFTDEDICEISIVDGEVPGGEEEGNDKI